MTDLALLEERAINEAFRDPPNRTLSQWADDEVTLAPSEGGGAGKWRTDRMPFLREILDVMSDTVTEEVVVMKCSQVGITVGMVLLVIYFMVEEPTTILFVEPNEDMVKKLSTKRLMPNIASTPVARGRILESASGGARHSGNTITQKDFPGGYLVIAWASSPSQLRSLPARVILKDETDAYEPTNEGDPTELAERAATTFGDRRKVVDASTPTIKHYSRIEKRFAESDQRYFHVPCPDCQHEQVLTWPHVTFDTTDARTAEVSAKYACQGCGVLWDDQTKNRAVAKGRWIATHPERARVGFHLNALLSPYVTLGRLAKEWVLATGDPEKLMVFINLKLGETFEDRSNEAAVGGFLARPRLPEGMIPKGVGMLTCMVDVQGDRLEALVMGHGGASGKELYPIEHFVIQGDPAGSEVWEKLDTFRKQTWPHECGDQLRLTVLLVDVGYLESTVIAYTKKREGQRVFGVRGKGRKRPMAPMLARRPSKNNSQGARVWEVNTDKSKDLLFRFLRVQSPAMGYIHCPAWFDEEHLDQLANSERKVPKKMPGGEIKLTWKKIRPRNEMLDLFCGNIIAAESTICGMTVQQIARRAALLSSKTPVPSEETPAEQPETPRPIPRRKNSWASRWRNG